MPLPTNKMTLDDFQRQAAKVMDDLRIGMLAALEEGVKSGLDNQLMIAIVEREMEKLSL